MDIPIDATISCIDGPSGESTFVVLDPTTGKIPHFVVKEIRFPNVDEFLIDPVNGHVTHLIHREAHLLTKKDVTIPVAQVDHISDDSVYLKLDKSSTEALPSIPVRRRETYVNQ